MKMISKQKHEGGETASRKCPNCHSNSFWKNGKRKTSNGLIQRYVCRECDYRFSKSDDFLRKNIISNLHQTNSRQICALKTERVKNLVKVESRTEASQRESNTNGQTISFAWHLTKLGRKETTITTYTRYLKSLSKNGNLNEPESIKMAIATKLKDVNTKRSATFAYDAFMKYIGLTWEKPQYKREYKKVFIPTEEELQIAINSGNKTTLAFSKLIYETGARKNEAERLEWTDIDRKRIKITVKASKNGNPRIITVSKKLIETLFDFLKNSNLVFPHRAKCTRQGNFHSRIKKLASIHNNPRLRKIHYHTFRHCKALREYDKTKSVLHVKRILGHRSIMTIQSYVELYEEIYGDLKPENYVCETASTVKEAKKLIEQGFQYVCEIDGEKLFKKVK